MSVNETLRMVAVRVEHARQVFYESLRRGDAGPFVEEVRRLFHTEAVGWIGSQPSNRHLFAVVPACPRRGRRSVPLHETATVLRTRRLRDLGELASLAAEVRGHELVCFVARDAGDIALLQGAWLLDTTADADDPWRSRRPRPERMPGWDGVAPILREQAARVLIHVVTARG